jgi:hypothetical protein
MYSKGVEIPKVSFSALDYTEIEPGSYFIGFNLDLGGKLCKIDSIGTLTVIEGSGSGGGVISISDDGQGIVEVYNVDPTNPIVKFNGIETDGTTVTGDGTVLNPLTVSIVSITNVTHSELVTLKSTGSLKPGMMYRIANFQTIYDQPDFNLNGTPKTNPTVKTGPIEPIILTAISPNDFSLDAYQEDHPNDIIQYILEFTTPVTNTLTKGRIIKRIDDRGNESDFDHRNVLFKRYFDEIGDFAEYRDNGEAYQEFLAIPNQPDTLNNYLGNTFNNFKDNSTIAANYVFDLPNIILNLFTGDAVVNNKFHGYVMNVTVLSLFINNVINGSCTNLYGVRFLNNKFGEISNVYSRNGWDTNEVNKLTDLKIEGQTITNNIIGAFENIIGEIRISNSVLNEFSSNLFIGNYASLDIVDCNINWFKFNNIKAPVFMHASSISELVYNTFNYGTNGEELVFGTNDIKLLSYNTFSGPFVNNRGASIRNSIFKGRTTHNEFGYITNCVFGPNFGTTNFSEYNDDPNTMADREISEIIGNVIKGNFTSLTFGYNCNGNTFNGEGSDMVFGDYLTNNFFDNSYFKKGGIPILFDLTGIPQLYETFKTRIFLLEQSHNFTYVIGDTYRQSVNAGAPVFIKSEIINNQLTNIFINADSLSNSLGEYAWQIAPFTLIGTANGGFEQSRENTRLLNSSYIKSDPMVYQLSESLMLTPESSELGTRLFIATLDDLQEIYDNRVALGITLAEKVWSSTEYDIDHAWVIDFATGIASYELKSSTFKPAILLSKTYDYSLKLEYVDKYGATIIVDLN